VSFDDEDTDKRRTGAPLTETRHDRGLSSEIGFGNTDANGNAIPSRKRRRLTRMRREHDRARWQSKADRNLATGCTEIARLVSTLDLPRTIREEASALFRDAQEAELLFGRSIEQFAAACVFAACRCAGTNRSITEVASVTSCSEQQLQDGYSHLNRKFDLQPALQRPRGFVPEIATACGLPEEARHRALERTREAESSGIANGRDPSGVAAACVYVAAQDHGWLVTQADVAEAADVAIPTLRARRDELRANQPQ
jgi:transcription initiation factor TFIIB